ncbi:Crp/Fnr family transcriptional regulator [Cupriavidus sp. AU9028]|uniref:Crp/Fnr family transcriptional regulator n=1 Tax=Cupriavidus sp. AU9028 TaxID=2871157 RepID=UPI001C983408|nr:Crp/Fnr family transcriptional regulator [Cupriavidus sp. AU9028]MBY4899228.1 Crp/Fnr family transcriptional regulator [Cupriavidus sp. AU9028]
MNASFDTVIGNHLIRQLPEVERALLAPSLEPVALRDGQLLIDAGHAVRHVYFPTTAIVSLLSLQEDGATVELAAVGNEGVAGLPALTGGEPMALRCEVQRTGRGLRISAADLRALLPQLPGLQRLTMRYMQFLLTQIGATAACIRHRPLMEQLCRWLLLSLDRVHGDELTVTQQRIANMLGVRREGVTEAVARLESLHLIEHSRGRIRVIDRHGLEEISGESYRIVQHEIRRLVQPRGADVAPMVLKRAAASAH